MDHLPPNPVNYRPVVVPLLCSPDLTFTPRSFITYRADHNLTWEIIKPLCKIKRPLSPDEEELVRQWAPHLQAWLYFAFLAAALQLPVAVSDFTSMDETAGSYPAITTRTLRPLIRRWHADHEAARAEPERMESRRTLSLDALNITRIMLAHIMDLAAAFGSEEAAFGEQILLDTLTHALCNSIVATKGEQEGVIPIEYSQVKAHAASDSLWLNERMSADGWCPGVLQGLWDIRVALPLQYYLSLFGPPLVRNHENCTGYHGCASLSVFDKTYRTKHVTEGCICNFLSPDMETLGRVVENDGIPVLELACVNGADVIRVKEYRPGIQYTAISHVWADGLGNPEGNELPCCQIKQIIAYIGALPRTPTRIDWCENDTSDRMTATAGVFEADAHIPERSKNKPCYFWIDTICVPKGNKAQEHGAIINMRQVYEQVRALLLICRCKGCSECDP